MMKHDPHTARSGADNVRRWLVLVAGVIAIASLHYVTDHSRIVLHEIYNYLCYVPIIVAAYWYGARGGLIVAAVTSGLFIPHIRGAWAQNAAYSASLYAQVVAFHVLGLTLGLLAAAQQRLTTGYRDAALSLERANRELHDSQEQLRRADRLSALGTMAAGLAHEIRNPLAGVKGALEIIGSRISPGTPEAEFALIGERELGRLEAMLTDFLTYARPHDPALRTTQLHEIVERVTALLKHEADKKAVSVVPEVPPTLPPVLADAEQMTQVVFNIVLNAIQATRASGHIVIREFSEPGWQVLDIIDEGPGIPAEHALRLFDPFFTTKPHGTGLGLAISYRIVTAHRGTIEALPGSGGGSVFRIRLPAAQRLDASVDSPVRP